MQDYAIKPPSSLSTGTVLVVLFVAVCIVLLAYFLFGNLRLASNTRSFAVEREIEALANEPAGGQGVVTDTQAREIDFLSQPSTQEGNVTAEQRVEIEMLSQ